jgi:hypothetical protein
VEKTPEITITPAIGAPRNQLTRKLLSPEIDVSFSAGQAMIYLSIYRWQVENGSLS